MTLFEKAAELGLELIDDGDGPRATGCPSVHGLTMESEDLAFCPGRSCGECYAREYIKLEVIETVSSEEMAKRKELAEFCSEQKDCYSCPLNYWRCRNGYGFLINSVKQYLSTEEIEDTYNVLKTVQSVIKEPELVIKEPELVIKATHADNMRHFDTGAVRDTAKGKGRYDLLPFAAIHALAQHCERGAEHYGERNVDKGIPQHSLIDSAIRHLGLYVQGDSEDFHLVAALWNIAWACEQEAKRSHLVDLPERSEKSGRAI